MTNPMQLSYVRDFDDVQQCRNPGPGTYNVPRSFGKAPAFSFGQRTQTFDRQRMPGPETYSPQHFQHGGFSLGVKPYIVERERAPSPTTYSPARSFSPIASSILQRTQILNFQTKTPDPAYYSPQRPKSGFQQSFLERSNFRDFATEHLDKYNYTSPAYYSPQRPPSPTFTFRERTFLKNRDPTPGPGAYKHKSEFQLAGKATSNTAKGFSFGSRPRHAGCMFFDK